MNKRQWSFPLLLASLLTLFTLAPACAPSAPTPTPAASIPVINDFTANPANISQGQQFTLSWTVSGADTVNIRPEVGIVGATGRLQLTPAATTTYTLTATSPGGSADSTATVTVVPLLSGQPDLVITDVYLQGQTIYYKITNQGTAAAGRSTTTLYINNLQQSTDEVDPLATGQESSTSFSNWEWPYGSMLPVIQAQSPGQYTQYAVRVCADTGSTVAESNEGNNCLSIIQGQLFSYDFTVLAHLAEWRSGAAALNWPMFAGDTRGAAYLRGAAPGTLIICPQLVTNGWIRGTYADFYYETGSRVTRTRLITVPPNCTFVARVGLEPGVAPANGATIAFGYTDNTGNVVLLNKMAVMSGQLQDYQVDLSTLSGMQTDFVLWVEANGPPEGTCVRWEEPRIVQAARAAG